MTDKSLHDQIKDIFSRALELEVSQRSKYLDEACMDDPEMRAEVESLLDSFEKSENFIEQPAANINDAISAKTEIDKHFGNYKIIKEIGKGGMGVVYLAAREDEEFRKRVAIKLVKRGLDTEDVLRRFRNERQILASLHHPNIAQLLDGGTTDDGLPYFVMEYVEGLPLLQYCDEKELSTPERLDLFKTICSAVQHAHQNLVIHRDLKPSNILISHDGEPKLLDFGVAKFLNPELMGDSSQTQTQFRVMTPEYASPEQIRGQHITTASDIYSLGVILYELLTGERPFKFDGKSLDQILQTVSQSEPIAPSSVNSRKITTGEQNPKTKVKNVRSLRGDLDNIVLMALRKEPSRRYKSVEQFADDIQRHLKGMPVVARPNTFSYRAEKFFKRNLVASSVGALLILSLIGGIAASLWFANMAWKESVKAQKINAFLKKTFTQAPFEAKGQNLKFAEVLDTATQRVETELGNEPEVKFQILITLADTYSRIGLSEKGEIKAREALELGNQVYGETSPYTSYAVATLANILLQAGKIDDSQQQYEKVVEIEKKISPKGGQIYGIALGFLAEICVRKGKLQEAIEFQQKALEMNRRFFGEESTYVAANFIGLGRANERLGNLDEAEKNYRYSIEVNRKLLPNSRPNYAEALLGLGSTLAKLGKFEESEKVLLESVSIFKDIKGANSMPVAEFQNYLMIMYYLRGDYKNAEIIGTETYKMFIDNGGKDTNGYYSALDYLGVAMAKNGKVSEGKALVRESLEKRMKTAIPNDWRIFNTKNLLGVCLTEENNLEEAEQLFLESISFFSKTYGENDYRTIESKKYLKTLTPLLKQN